MYWLVLYYPVVIIFGTLLFTFFTWGMYLSVMNLMRIKDTMSFETKLFAYPLAAIGLICDFLYNVIVGTMLFLELPKEWLLTKRLQRYLNSDSWRGNISRWLCTHLLDPFDPKGNHCGKRDLK